MVVATPAPDHLQELATLHAISVHRTKAMRLQHLFTGWPNPCASPRRSSYGHSEGRNTACLERQLEPLQSHTGAALNTQASDQQSVRLIEPQDSQALDLH